MAVIVVDGAAYRAMCGPVVFGDYLATSRGLLVVDRVIYCGSDNVLDCMRASEESVAWAAGLSVLTGVMRVIELHDIDQGQSSQSDW